MSASTSPGGRTERSAIGAYTGASGQMRWNCSMTRSEPPSSVKRSWTMATRFDAVSGAFSAPPASGTSSPLVGVAPAVRRVVHDDTDERGAGALERVDHHARRPPARRLRVEHEERRVTLRGHGERVGVHRAGRCVDDDQLRAVERVEHLAERTTAEHTDG